MRLVRLLLATAVIAAGLPAPALEPLQPPVNRWTRVFTAAAGPRPFQALVYSPETGQVLSWDRSESLWAFDAALGDWTGLPSASINAASGPRPALDKTYHGACWDAKRRQVIYTSPGLMAAYDPATGNWRDMKPRTALGWNGPAVLADHFYEGPALVLGEDPQPGPPPCYGLGTCYDPVNDQILLFPHFGAANLDMVGVNGNISGHLGTLVYSFQDNTWRRVAHTLGAEPVRRARKALLDLIGSVSRAVDSAWASHSFGGVPQERVREAFAQALPALEALALLGSAEPLRAQARQALQQAAAGLQDDDRDAVLAAGGRALWALDQILNGPLRVEPPPRCGTPLVYDPQNQVLVMFGGHSGLVRNDLWPPGQGESGPGRLNDTWLYDCRTRQWRDVSGPRRPPATLWPKLVYDPASKLVLLVTWEAGSGDERGAPAVTLWGFDAAKAEWLQLDRQPWPGPVYRSRHGGDLAEIALDQRTGLLVLAQGPEDRRGGVETYVFRLEVSRMKARPAPLWAEPAPLRPQAIAADDPAVVARLKALPANRWVHVRPPDEVAERGWGNAACDPIRGHVYYFGGGHASYQVNDVAIYAPGANRWTYAAGDHNDWIPPAYWDGTCMGLRGGPPAGHQRNYYCAVDGRMYASTGAESRRWGAESAKQPGRRYCWFYDLDRGGVWRRLPVETAAPPGVPGVYGKPNLAAPDGRIVGFGGGLEPYNGRFFPGEVYFSSLDTAANKLTIRQVTSGPACCPGEDRPFCFLPDKNQVFFYEYVGTKEKMERQATWVYDIQTDRFRDLKPQRQPPASPRTVEYIPDQAAVFAVVGDGQQWVYSFRHNSWAPLPLERDAPLGFAAPYAQVVYSAKYAVLVNVGSASRGTAVMRPDLQNFAW